jgi:hypothetical protein
MKFSDLDSTKPQSYGGQPLVRIDPDQEFVNEVVGVIQRTLTARFGADVMNVIMFNFRNSTNSQKEDIVRKPEQFENFLDQMFGNGSRIMRKLIIKSLEAHFKLESDRRNAELEDTLKRAWRERQALV